MKILGVFFFAAVAAATLTCGAANAQTPGGLPAQNFYFDDSAWPLPEEGAPTALRLTGMPSAHAVWMAFSRYDDGKSATDSPVMVLMEGFTVKWSAPGGCSYELQLVNSNSPQINMSKPRTFCALVPGKKVIFKILALP
jgi:hypothetical protein